MNKFNLVIDGNYHFIKTLNITKGYSNSKSKKYLSSKSDQEQFIRKITTDFLYILETFKGFNNIIFCFDSHSWRKDFYSEYKAKRSYKDDMDWDMLFALIDEFIVILEQQNIIVSRIKGAEGDDLLYYWSKYLNYLKENVVIVSADVDLSQLVNYNDDAFTIVYNSNSKNRQLIFKEGFLNYFKALQPKDDKTDIFNMNTDIILNENFHSVLSGLINQIEVKEINPKEIIFNKIILGDDGDNVPAIWRWGDIKPNGNYAKRITPKYYNKLIEQINLKEFDLKDESEIDSIRIILEDSTATAKSPKIEIDKEKFLQNFHRNRKLVRLNKEEIPPEITMKFAESLKEVNFNKKIKTLDVKEFLKDTRFEKEIQVFSSLFT